MLRARQALAAAGVLLLAFGVFRLVTQVPVHSLIGLAGWLVAAVIIHDGVLAPSVVGVGLLLTRVPPRARRYLQSALVTAALVSVIAIPLILRRGTQPVAKAILQRNYAGGLALLLVLIAAVAMVRYVVRVTLDRVRPAPADPDAPTAAEGPAGTHSP